MALKIKRQIKETVTDYTLGEIAEKGMVVIRSSDTAVQINSVLASGQFPIGILLNDVVNKDLTQVPRNLHTDERVLNENVTLAIEGQVLTNQILAGVTIAAGDKAYISSSGLLSNAFDTALDTSDPDLSYQVGSWLSAKDSDGYALLNIKL